MVVAAPFVTGVGTHAAGARAVGDTIDAVFHGSAFVQAMHPSLLGGVTAWIVRSIGAVVQSAVQTPGVIPVIAWTLYLLTALVVVRLLYAGVRYALTTRRGAAQRWSAEGGAHLWAEADRLADGGDYTAAAHAVYTALMRTLVARGLVRAHPSKTIGDYVRELRRAPARDAHAATLVDAFTGFACAYEVVVYRDGVCDAARYAALRALTAPAAPRTMPPSTSRPRMVA